MLALYALLWPLVLAGRPCEGRMEVAYSWKTVDLDFPSDSLREVYLASGQLIPKNNAILDVDVWERPGSKKGAGRRIFVTLPKFKPGIPVTLATLGSRRGNSSLLKPYPDWSWHQGDCEGITSVYRTQMDKCGRLWVLDSGMIDTFMDQKQHCPPQILVFDPQTDQLIRRHRFPTEVLEDRSLLITITVDTRTKDCSDSMAYVADVEGYKLLVYDFGRDKSWRIYSNLFYPYPLHGSFDINGVEFDLMDGVFGLALGPIVEDDRMLYFHSLASVHESYVRTSVIRNSSVFEEDPGASPRAFHVFPETRSSQAAAKDMSDTGVLLYSLVEENAIGCWNTRLPFKKQNLDIIAKDDVTLQFQSGLKVYGNKIWTVSCRLQNYIAGTFNEKDINYRINVGRVSDLVRNSKCDPKKHSGSSNFLTFPHSRQVTSLHSFMEWP